MTRNCAVAPCKSVYRKGSGVSFFRFPRDPIICRKWVAACKRADEFDCHAKSSKVCSEHFTQKDYDPSYLLQHQLCPDATLVPCLRKDAVPSLNIPSAAEASLDEDRQMRHQRREQTKVVEEILHSENMSSSAASDEHEVTEAPMEVDLEICVQEPQETTPLEEIRRLEKQVRRLQRLLVRRTNRWRREKAVLVRQLRALQSKAEALDSLLEKGVLSDGQVRRARSGKRIKWPTVDIAKALGLRCITRKGFEYTRGVLKVPLPAPRTLSRWTRGVQLRPGIIEIASTVLKGAVEGMDDMQRLCVLSFDEMALSGRFSYDPMSDQVLSGSKLQVAMVRGLCAAWKQVIYFDLDAPMTLPVLKEMLTHLEGMGLRVVAAVSDMGLDNERLWKAAGVSMTQTWIDNPADQERRVWIFADPPHLMKLLRTHTMDPGGGMLVPREDPEDNKALLSRQCFQELKALDRGELRVCPKLTDLHIEASKQAAQRVYLATQTFSNTVGTAMATYLPRRATQASAILAFDKWFDVLNSRVPFDARAERCGFDVRDGASGAQTAALQAAEHLISGSQKFYSRTGKGRRTLMPFQVGMLRCIHSLRGLASDVRRSVPGVTFLLTSHLNQDCVENFFSQLRGMCGANQMPDSADARARLRILLMAPAPLVAANSGSHRCAVELEQNTSLLTTGHPLEDPNSLSSEALEGVVLQGDGSASAAAEVEAEIAEVDAAFQTWLADTDPGSEDSQPVAAPSAAPAAPVPAAAAPDGEPTDGEPTGEEPADEGPASNEPTGELGLASEGLTFVAGYVAAKCRHVDPTLGSITSERPGAVTSTWLRAISRGGLTVPTEPWMNTVRDFETLFSLVMGSSVCGEAGIMRRLMNLLGQKRPDLDKRVVRKLVSTRLHVRLRWLNRNRKITEESAMRRSAKQIRQHANS